MTEKTKSKGSGTKRRQIAQEMESHYCIQQGNVGKLTEAVNKVSDKVFGNGQPGLIATVPVLSTKIDTLSTKIDGLSTNVSALMKYSDQDFGANRAVEKRKLSNAQWTAIVFSAILSLGGIIVTIILKT